MVETAKETKEPNSLVKIGERTYNLLDAFPMTLGDWEDMNELGIMDGGKLLLLKPRQMLDMIHLLLKKLDGSVTRDQVRAINVKDMPNLIGVVRKLLDKEDEQTENPTTSS